MDLPFDLPTLNSVECPCCTRRIGMHLLKEVFACPHCGLRLQTNIGRAYNEGAAIFIGALAAWFAVAVLIGIEFLAIGSSIAVIVAFYLAHFWYRRRLTVRRLAQQDGAGSSVEQHGPSLCPPP